jgi:MinD-like ATPase involved in chromosome partitioning or flagellar assembly
LGGGADRGGNRGNRGIGAYNTVDRYSGADKIVADILKIYSLVDNASQDTEASSAGRDSKIVAILSFSGGCGRTSVAIALCSHFTRLGLRSLYLNIDFTGVEGHTFAYEHDGGLSDIIYSIRARPDKLAYKLEALGKLAPGHGFYFYAPPVYPLDIDEIQPADMETLFAGFRRSGLYDRIVVDTHAGLSLRNKTLAELAECTFIVTRSGLAGYKSAIALKEQIDKCYMENAHEIYKRCHIIVNCIDPNYTDVSGDIAFEHAKDIGIAFSARVATIPYCGEIKDDYNPLTLASLSNGFGAAFAELARKT